MVEVESHESVAGIEARQEDCGIGLCAGVGLHVGILGSEELADAVDGYLLHFVHHLAAAIVALAGVAFGVFVGQARTHGPHDLFADVVLRGNKFHASVLSLILFLDKGEDG